jgi:hypothetical protein
MKKALFLLLFTPVLLMAQGSPFDGTWRVNLQKSQLSRKPEVFSLQNGMYSCKTCAPPIEIKADGSDQKVTGHPYFETMAVKAVDDHHVDMTTKKAGKVMGEEKDEVSSDGNTLTVNWTDNTNPQGGPVTGKTEMKRVSKGPAGANLISGSWRNEKVEDIPADALTFTYKTTGQNELSYSTPTGQSYTAKLNGGDAPFKGDPGTTSVSIKAINDKTLEETDKRDGKVISVSRITVSPDGKTLTIDSDDKLHNAKSKWVAEKQG